MNKKAQQVIAQQAKNLPPLPETASALAVELHERAQAMLRVRLENIEVYVSNLVDESVRQIVQNTIQQAVNQHIVELVKARVAAVVFQELDSVLLEVVALIDLRKDWLGRIREQLNSQIWKLLGDRVAEAAPTVAEKLARGALQEVERYYGSAAILSAEDGERK